MKQMTFLKTFFAALLAFVVANMVLGLMAVMFIVGIAAVIGTSSSTEIISSKTILKIDLGEQITDSPISSPMNSIDFSSFSIKGSVSLFDAISAIEYAATDPNIEGIYLNPSPVSMMSMATREELREALSQFKESGKFIVAYNEVYSQGGYYLASVADKVYMNPEGGVLWNGLASNIMFYKGLFDKLGIQPEVIRHGSFKAAVEPYISDRMSPENRMQMDMLLGSAWGTIVGQIAESRGIDSTELQRYASELAIALPEDALNYKLVDSLLYQDQVMAQLNVRIAEDDLDKEPKFVTLGRYSLSLKPTISKKSQNKIGIIYADGVIMDGKSSDQEVVGSQTLIEQLIDARKDESIKAVVLRVNSPGGSALASEVMWREIELLKKEKPVVVSMGGVAASGGYYISAPADIIVANRMTITGSIGVYGVLFNVQKGLEQKLGITVDVAKTSPSADMGVPFRPLSAGERAYITKGVERVYTTFVKRVSDGRNLSTEEVDKIGGGRVWSGVDAEKIGLIDGFGGLKHAILLAADRAGIAQDFRIKQILDKEDPLQMVFKSLTSGIKAATIQNELGLAMKQYNKIMSILEGQGIQARMPYSIEME